MSNFQQAKAYFNRLWDEATTQTAYLANDLISFIETNDYDYECDDNEYDIELMPLSEVKEIIDKAFSL